MSTLSGINASAGAGYAIQLASSAALKRSLSNLETAINNGALDAAGTILTQIMNANPQYANSAGSASSTSPSPGPGSTDPINQGFADVSRAIAADQVEVARSAWAQLKNYLTQKGVTGLNDGGDAISKLVAETRASVDEGVLTGLFANSYDPGNPLLTLLEPAPSAATGSGDPVGSALSNWLTYQAAGSSATTVSDSSARVLNSIA